MLLGRLLRGSHPQQKLGKFGRLPREHVAVFERHFPHWLQYAEFHPAAQSLAGLAPCRCVAPDLPRTAASIYCRTIVAPAPCPFHISHAQTLLAQLKLPGHTPQASTAPLQNLSAKLVKARHCLHAVNLQVETIRNECDKARREVEASDTEISGMEHEEERLKLQYVESAPAGHYSE